MHLSEDDKALRHQEQDLHEGGVGPATQPIDLLAFKQLLIRNLRGINPDRFKLASTRDHPRHKSCSQNDVRFL